MSTHKHIDLICVAVLVCTVLITVLFMNGERYGLTPVIDWDAENSTGSPWFTRNDRDGDWDAAGATRIELKGDTASVRGGGAYAYDGDVVIAQAGRYVLSGALTDGSVIVSADGTAKVWIKLDGADISCSDDACIRVDQADKVFLTLAAGSENSLTSGSEYTEEAVSDKRGGAVFSHDDLTVNGSGSLRVAAGFKHGFDVNDELVITGGAITIDAPQDGLHANDSLRIENAALKIRAGDEGLCLQNPGTRLVISSGSFDIRSVGAGVKCAGDLLVENGALNVESDGDAIHCEGSAQITGGAFSLNAADEGVRCEGELLIQGGAFSLRTESDAIHCAGTVTIEGGTFALSSGDDGIHSDTSVVIRDGSILIDKCYEGVEAKTIEIAGGEIEICPTDDGLNANGGSFGFGPPGMMGQEQSDTEEEACWIRISGGSVTVVNKTARDADGLDSNGDILISGGVLRVSLDGSGSNNAIDFGSESGGVCEISGGEIVACGGSVMAEAVSESSTQCAVMYNLGTPAPAGTTVRLLDMDGKELLSYTAPCSFTSVTLSSPGLKLGQSYVVAVGSQEETITLENISDTYGEKRGGNMGWGSLRGPGGGPDFANMGPPPEMNGERPEPPDMPPPGMDGEMPDFANMGPPPGMDGGRGKTADRQELTAAPKAEQTPEPAETPGAEEAADETAPPDETAVGPRTVDKTTWIMVGACLLVLLAGILFAVKYRV